MDVMDVVAHSRLSRVPLAGNYAAAVALALVALSPFIVLSTASQLLTPQLIKDLHASMFSVQLADGLANAGYAFGAVAAADLIQRFASWRLYVLAEIGFAGGSILAAFAPSVTVFTAGRVVQGVATGMLLVAALPPLITRHGADRLPLTAAFVNLGLFGMVSVGPAVGGVFAGGVSWRLLFVIVAGLGLAGAALGVTAVQRDDGDNNRTMGFDKSAIPVALAATALPFFGVSWLTRGGFTSPAFYVPVVAGLLALGSLLLRQYRKQEALMPLRLIAHTLPVTGIATAMVTGATVTACLELSIVYLQQIRHEAAGFTGAVLAVMVIGVAVGAVLFKAMLRTRWLPAFALIGLGAAGASALLLLALSPSRAIPVVAVAGVLLGFAAGAGVSPGLFMAGLSAPSNKLGPTFAFVELLRAEAAFLVAPVVLQLAMQVTPTDLGIRLGLVVLVVLCAVSGAAILAVLLLGGSRPQKPDLQAWVGGDQPAYDSPPLAATIRNV
jgi:MFS family permease